MNLSDLRSALRALMARRGYAGVSLLTIALVVGAGGAVMAVVNAAFLRPLPFTDESHLVWIFTHPPGTAGTTRRNPLQSPAYVKMREHLRAVTDLAGLWERDRALQVDGGAETVDAAGVSANAFQTAGVSVASGRMFTEEEDRADAKVALISDGFWRGRLGGAPVLGTQLIIDGEPHVVIGVLAPIEQNGFLDAEVFTPLAMHGGNLPSPNATLVTGLARVPAGVSRAEAQADLDAAMNDTIKDRPVMNGWTASFMPVRDALFGDTRPVLAMLLAAIALLGAIASANLANVTIAEISSRTGELSLRAALGAGRGDLIRLVLVEQLILAVVGGGVGLLAARLSLPLLLSIDPGVSARLGHIPIDWRVQVSGFALALVVSALSGVIPTIAATRGDLAHALAASGRRSAGSRRQVRARAWLVAGQTALAAVLLTVSALLIGAFRQSMQHPPGFDPTNVFGAQIRLPDRTYPGVAERAAFVKRLVAEMRALPGVVSASAGFNSFQGGGYNTSLSIEGQPTPDGRPYTVQFRRAAPGYFALMKIPELKGRTFTDQDDLNTQWVCVVSQSFVDRYFPGEDPIGRRLIRASDPTHPVTIVGVVANVRDTGLTTEPGPTFYLPFSQNNLSAAPISLVVRTAADPRSMQRDITTALHRIDASLPLTDPTTMEAFLNRTLGPSRFRGVLLTALAMLGLLLAIVGITGVTSRGVTERTRELGVRLALGSGRAGLWMGIVRRAMASVCLGMAVAMPLAYGASKITAQWMPGVSEVSLWTAAPAWVALFVAGVIAAALPALRAARLDPIVALRSTD